jgi:branched-chain amino acid transport system ATP-binding protein
MSLEARAISKSYGGYQALDDVSFRVETGGLFGLIGPNGAGKSTLFSVLSGFLKPDSGRVFLDDRSVEGLSAPARARAGMVRTFQVPRDFHHLTVRENLMAAAPGQVGESLPGLFFRPGKVRRQEAEVAAKAADIMAFLRLVQVADQPAGKLSGGQKKLVELGRALMVEPRLILLDEPFAGVNAVLIAQIGERILELNSRGIGFLVIEHDLEALTRLVPHLAVLDRGRIIAEGTPEAVLDDPLVRDAYLGGSL